MATPFEHRSFAEELSLAQRYYFTTWPNGTSVGTNIVSTNNLGVAMVGNSSKIVAGGVGFPTTMRANPSISVYSPTGTANKYYERHGASDFTFNTSGIRTGQSYAAFNEYDGGANASREGYIHIFCDAEL